MIQPSQRPFGVQKNRAVRGGLICPLPLPVIAVTEKVVGLEARGVDFLQREIAKEISWRERGVLRIEARFQEVHPLRVCEAVGECHSPVIHLQKLKSQPSAIRRSLSQGAIEKTDFGTAQNRCSDFPFPSCCLEAKSILQRVEKLSSR